jgi:hypothetical protein
MSTKSKINFGVLVLDFYGKPVTMPDQSKEPIGHIPDGRGGTAPRYPETTMPLHQACVNALGQKYAGEENMSREEQQKRWRLGAKVAKAKINGTGEVTLKPDEITDILICANKAYPPFIFGYIQAMLNPDEVDEQLLNELGKEPTDAKE